MVKVGHGRGSKCADAYKRLRVAKAARMAQILCSKYGSYPPLYRQSQMFKNEGINLGACTRWPMCAVSSSPFMKAASCPLPRIPLWLAWVLGRIQDHPVNCVAELPP